MKETNDKKYFQNHSEWIDDHLSQFYSDNEVLVFHEIFSPDFHLDVYFVDSEKHAFNILITSGMSSMRMNVDENIQEKENLQFAELMILLPKNIEFENLYTGENKNDWIISLLKQTARFPHHYDTWIGIGHTIQASEDLEPYDEKTEFVGAIILPSVTFDDNFTEIIKEGEKINIYTIFPLYKNEIEYKIKNGFDKFLDLLIKANAKEILDNKRENLL